MEQLEEKDRENHSLQKELQQLETERVRLSLVEDTALDVTTLLRKLRGLVSID